MRIGKMFVVALVGVAMLAPLALAQDTPPARRPRRRVRRSYIDRVAGTLELTEAQKANIQDIIEDNQPEAFDWGAMRERFRAARAADDGGESMRKLREEMAQLRAKRTEAQQGLDKKITTYLARSGTAKQQAAFKAYVQRRTRMRQPPPLDGARLRAAVARLNLEADAKKDVEGIITAADADVKKLTGAAASKAPEIWKAAAASIKEELTPQQARTFDRLLQTMPRPRTVASLVDRLNLTPQQRRKINEAIMDALTDQQKQQLRRLQSQQGRQGRFGRRGGTRGGPGGRGGRGGRGGGQREPGGPAE